MYQQVINNSRFFFCSTFYIVITVREKKKRKFMLRRNLIHRSTLEECSVCICLSFSRKKSSAFSIFIDTSCFQFFFSTQTKCKLFRHGEALKSTLNDIGDFFENVEIFPLAKSNKILSILTFKFLYFESGGEQF
jgi:hypothetical protein